MSDNFKPAVAIDFDGTISSSDNKLMGEIPPPRKNAAKVINAWRKDGIIIIINTLREGRDANAAIDYMKKHGIEWDYFNENIPERIERYYDCRKIGADLHIDDKNIGGVAEDFAFMFEEVESKLLSNINEIWVNVDEYDGIYEVSNFSNIRSLGSYDSLNRFRAGKILSPIEDKDGYFTVNLYKNKSKKNFKIHRLVASSFIQNTNNLPQVNHIDEDKSFNLPFNLEWVTNRYNCNHSKNKKSTSKYPGVSWNKALSKWSVRCHFNGKNIYLGNFNDELIAAKQYEIFCKENNLNY